MSPLREQGWGGPGAPAPALGRPPWEEIRTGCGGPDGEREGPRPGTRFGPRPPASGLMPAPQRQPPASSGSAVGLAQSPRCWPPSGPARLLSGEQVRDPSLREATCCPAPSLLSREQLACQPALSTLQKEAPLGGPCASPRSWAHNLSHRGLRTGTLRPGEAFPSDLTPPPIQRGGGGALSSSGRGLHAEGPRVLRLLSRPSGLVWPRPVGLGHREGTLASNGAQRSATCPELDGGPAQTHLSPMSLLLSWLQGAPIPAPREPSSGEGLGLGTVGHSWVLSPDAGAEYHPASTPAGHLCEQLLSGERFAEFPH